MAGQHNRQEEKVTGQQAFLAGHCPLIGRYIEPCKREFEKEKFFLTHMLNSNENP